MSAAARLVTVAATQIACGWELASNLDRAERLVREAHGRGARIILLQELFATPYFCIEQDPKHLQLAQSADDSPLLRRFGALAAELEVVLPVSFF
jgi:N-carbamoylputrescine amidase